MPLVRANVADLVKGDEVVLRVDNDFARRRSTASSGYRGHVRAASLWTSADAAGFPILPGLVRYDEVVEKGALKHAMRFTLAKSRRAYVPPARASSHNDGDLPPMGMRVRLRADFDTSDLAPEAKVILEALKKYGMILADIGCDDFISGAPDARWNVDNLRQPMRETAKSAWPSARCLWLRVTQQHRTPD
jgi:hypothetical protein